MDYFPSTSSLTDAATDPSVTETGTWNGTSDGVPGLDPRLGIWTAPVVQRVAILSVLMVLTLVGNGVIILVVSAAGVKKGLNRVNIFILHLAIGDICVCLVTMTTEIVFVAFGQWVLGAALCKLIVYGQIVTLASTTFILTAMSLDRHQAITDPLNVVADPEGKAKKMITVAWGMAFAFALPQLFIFVQREKEGPDGVVKYECVSQGYTAEWQRQVYVTWMTLYVLVAPAVIITCCYVRMVVTVWRTDREQRAMSVRGEQGMRRTGSTITSAKIKTIKMTLCIVVGFVTCWSPYFIVTLYEVYTGNTLPDVTYVVAETMALFNSAFNPFIYGFFNLNVKSAILAMLPCSWADAYRSRPSSMMATEETYTEAFLRRSIKRLSRSSLARNTCKGNGTRRATPAMELQNLATRRQSLSTVHGRRVLNTYPMKKTSV